MKYYILSLLLLFFLCSCEQAKNKTESPKEKIKIEKNTSKTLPVPQEKVINRLDIIKALHSKIENNIPLIVHVNVPLCDNKNQGIIPTSESLGDGLDLKRNLYWATSKGMKRYFNELKDWNLVYDTLGVNKDILERVIFKKIFDNGAIVYLVADAYRGDRMIECLSNHFNSLSGVVKDHLVLKNDTIGIYGNADLLAFNGHNGLMDEEVFMEANIDNRNRDAVSISCISGDYFKSRYERTNSYPLVYTTNLLYPGAFILEEIINSWANLASDSVCKIAAGNSYYKHKPKSGPNGSQNLFSHGW